MHLYRRIIVTLILTVVALFLMSRENFAFWPGLFLLIISLLRLHSINRDFLKYEETEKQEGGEDELN